MSATPTISRSAWLMLLGLGLSCLSATQAQEVPMALAFTAKQQAWLEEHRVVRIGYDPGWLPFSGRAENGEFIGIDRELIDNVLQRVGLQAEWVGAPTWREVYQKAVNGEIDLLVGMAKSREREEFFAFSESYFSSPVVVITRQDQPFFWSMQDLGDKRVAGPEGYAPVQYLAENVPGISLIPTNTTLDALQLVAHKQADAAVANLPSASYNIKLSGLTNLKIVGVLPETFALRYAVRKDWQPLVEMLNLAIAAVPDVEKQAITHKWIRVDYARVIRWDIVWRAGLSIILVFVGIVGAITWRNRTLAAEIAKRTQLQLSLQQAHDGLARLNEDKNALLRMLVHDLRSPLTALSLGLEYLRQKLTTDRQPLVTPLLASVRKMEHLVADLLDVQLIEEGQRRFSWGMVDLVACAKASLVNHETMAGPKRTTLKLTAATPDELFGWADTGAVNQVIDNLISNAIKYCPPGSLVEVSIREWNGQARLDVVDNGPGVKPEEVERIFSKYGSGSARPTGGESSTGLGLMIVRQLTMSMNGRIWCEANETGGARFSLILPLEAPPTPFPSV